MPVGSANEKKPYSCEELNARQARAHISKFLQFLNLFFVKTLRFQTQFTHSS